MKREDTIFFYIFTFLLKKKLKSTNERIKMKNIRNMKIAKKITLISCAAVLFVLTTAVVLAFVFENKIAEVVLNQAYKNTTAEIKHKDISFSLLRKFPMASLQVNNINVVINNDFPLLNADMIFLQFSILDVFRETYTLRKIEIKNADLHLIIDKDGTANWDIFIADTSETKPLSIELKTIQLHNVDVRFEHQQQKLDIATHCNNLAAKGNFNDRVFSTNLYTELKIKYIQSDTVKYFENKSLKLRTELNIDTEKNEYKMQDGSIDFEGIKFNTNAKLQQKEKDYALNVKIRFENVDAVKVLKEMPPSVQETIKQYKPTASLSGNIAVNASFGSKYNVSIGGDFACKNGSIQNTENDIRLSNTAVKGNFSTQIPQNISQTKINITAFSTHLNKGSIEGRFSLENLENPP